MLQEGSVQINVKRNQAKAPSVVSLGGHNSVECFNSDDREIELANSDKIREKI